MIITHECHNGHEDRTDYGGKGKQKLTSNDKEENRANCPGFFQTPTPTLPGANVVGVRRDSGDCIESQLDGPK